jgi:hypothetical protein
LELLAELSRYRRRKMRMLISVVSVMFSKLVRAIHGTVNLIREPTVKKAVSEGSALLTRTTMERASMREEKKQGFVLLMKGLKIETHRWWIEIVQKAAQLPGSFHYIALDNGRADQRRDELWTRNMSENKRAGHLPSKTRQYMQRSKVHSTKPYLSTQSMRRARLYKSDDRSTSAGPYRRLQRSRSRRELC